MNKLSHAIGFFMAKYHISFDWYVWLGIFILGVIAYVLYEYIKEKMDD